MVDLPVPAVPPITKTVGCVDILLIEVYFGCKKKSFQQFLVTLYYTFWIVFIRNDNVSSSLYILYVFKLFY